ncbi:MAG: tRNA-dihydrouridine synthase family protein [Planctomycetes bacterium]|nr:tRNA-dihydrouridine synthase family protein [Planctomycetota bacterium]
MQFRDRVFLAPLTKGGNLPFRRLCVTHGCEATMSEMAYAYQVVRKSRSELALLRKHDDESCFGVQLAVSRPDDAVTAGMAAVERGAQWLDVNCGCPIRDVVKRGMGAVLMQKPQRLARIIEAMTAALSVPVTVKLRLGWSAAEQNVSDVARIAEEAGAAAIAVHGRTREQRYAQAADWDAIARIAAERSVPVIGNGDLLTWYEVRERWRQSGVAAVMIGRGALIKPWIFREIAESREIEPDAEERIAIWHGFAQGLKAHFRDDEKGHDRAMRFLPWHLGFACRYRPLPRAIHEERSRRYPLMQSRSAEESGELSLSERLLRDPRPELHAELAELLWSAADAAEACDRAGRLAIAMPPVAGDPDEVATAHG